MVSKRSAVHRLARTAIAIAAGLTASAAAFAYDMQILVASHYYGDPGHWVGNNDGNSLQYAHPTEVSYNGPFASYVASNSPSPYLFTSVAAEAGSYPSATAWGYITYQVTVTGAPNTRAQVDFLADWAIAATGGAGSYVSLWISGNGTGFDQNAHCNPDHHSECGLGSYQGVLNPIVGNNGTAVLDVQIWATAEANYNSWNWGIGYRNGGAASAFIDPMFSIDPTWAADNPGYGLSIESGMGNALADYGTISGHGSVPEPGSLALTGLAAAALLRTRRARVGKN